MDIYLHYPTPLVPQNILPLRYKYLNYGDSITAPFYPPTTIDIPSWKITTSILQIKWSIYKFLHW